MKIRFILVSLLLNSLVSFKDDLQDESYIISSIEMEDDDIAYLVGEQDQECFCENALHDKCDDEDCECLYHIEEIIDIE